MRLRPGDRAVPVPGTEAARSRLLCLGVATSIALSLHAGLLLLGRDASGSSHSIAARVMAVRMLPSQPAAAPAAPSAAVAPIPDPVVELAPAPGIAAAEASHASTRMHADHRRATRSISAPVDAPPPPAPPTVPANGGLPPAPDYLLGARLDPGPRPLGDIEPEYPEAANLQEGMVVLRLLISATGVVDDVAVVKADPKGVFDDAAVVAFKAARFSPGMVLGTPVKSQITVEVEFQPINRGARISGRTY